MPQKTINKYSDIPGFPSYLLSSCGKIIKKKTWKEISVNEDGLSKVTENGRRRLLTVPKLLRDLFPTPTQKSKNSIQVEATQDILDDKDYDIEAIEY